MKFRVSFKTPDVLDSVIEEQTDTHCENHFDGHDLNCNDCILLEEKACANVELIKGCAEQFIKYNEYITIEFDTEKDTATVIPIHPRV